MSNTIGDKLSEFFKRALCDCLCTNVDLDLDNANNNQITIHVTPTKISDDSSEKSLYDKPTQTTSNAEGNTTQSETI